MKLMVASDIHGSAYYCRELMEAYKEENPDRLILLGDLLYHGPRNDLPKEYNPKAVTAMLNEMSDNLLCVRGNCDAEIDEVVLDAPIGADYAYICVDGLSIIATHGHLYGEECPPKHKKGDILLCGHTHVPGIREHDDFTYVNPGSVSIPKEDSNHSYMIIEDGRFSWKSLNA